MISCAAAAVGVSLLAPYPGKEDHCDGVNAHMAGASVCSGNLQRNIALTTNSGARMRRPPFAGWASPLIALLASSAAGDAAA